MFIDVKCKKCPFVSVTVFGVIGTTQVGDPLQKCPECGSEIEAKYPIRNPSDSIE